MKYVIGTGFWADENEHEKRAFFDLWWENTHRYAKPDRVFVVNSNAPLPEGFNKRGCWIDMCANLGHIHHLVEKKNHKYGGWSVSFIVSAWCAYASDRDFIYKEQDCLAFGPWVERLYKEMNAANADMVWGHKKHDNLKTDQGLVLMKRGFIPKFLTEWGKIEEWDHECLPETKFWMIAERRIGKQIAYHSVGWGGDRPADLGAECLQLQRITKGEIEALRKTGRM